MVRSASSVSMYWYSSRDQSVLHKCSYKGPVVRIEILCAWTSKSDGPLTEGFLPNYIGFRGKKARKILLGLWKWPFYPCKESWTESWLLGLAIYITDLLTDSLLFSFSSSKCGSSHNGGFGLKKKRISKWLVWNQMQKLCWIHLSSSLFGILSYFYWN